MRLSYLYHGHAVGHIKRLPSSGIVGGPGGRKGSRLPIMASLRTTQRTQRRRPERRAKEEAIRKRWRRLQHIYWSNC